MRRSARPTIALAGLLLLSVARSQEASTWIDRMSEAVEALNYQGRLVHFVGDDAEALYVIHRSGDGEIGERIVALDGVGREIVRRGAFVRWILPDERVVLLEEGSEHNPLNALPEYSEALDVNYKLKLYNEQRLLDRQAQIVGLHSRDEFRYSYVLWLDKATAMPLKIQLWGDAETKLEEIRFTSIEFPGSIPDSALEASIDTTGFTVLRSPEATRHASDEALPWQFPGLPSGFRFSGWLNRTIADSGSAIEHVVFRDGLATVSVFIEEPSTEADDVAEGFSSVGATNAFSLTVNGRKVTAVGEVPRRTVQGIVTTFSLK